MPLLFSYGTLQQEAVQLATFGRRLDGHPDELVAFERAVLTVQDPEFVARSGQADHAIVRYTGRQASRVAGTVLELSDAELAAADRYEPRRLCARAGAAGVGQGGLGLRRRDGAARSAAPVDPGRFATIGPVTTPVPKGTP